jgi:hypothetical protein
MNFIKHGFSLVVACFAVCAGALVSRASEENSVRIDFNGEAQGVTLKVNGASAGAVAKNSEWRKEKAPFWVTAIFPSRAATWSEGSITFTPAVTGRVVVILKGPYVRQKEIGGARVVWVYFDDLRVTGARLVNPGFEEIQANRPVGWYRPPPPAGVTLADELMADLDTTQPAEGRVCARVWHNSNYSQAIDVTAGQPVTLVFRHRLYE